MKKRILPALLALCMVISLLPVTVFAETKEPTADGSYARGEKAEAAISGLLEAGDVKGDDGKTVIGKVVQNVGTDPHASLNEGKCTATNCSCTLTVSTVKGETEIEVTDDEGETSTKKIPLTTVNATWSSLCAACQAEKTIADAEAAEKEAEAAAKKADCGKDNPTGSADCKNFDKHTPECEAACGEGGKDGGCTLDKGHEGNHANTKCIDKAGCSTEVAEHKLTCPSYEPKVTKGNDSAMGSTTIKLVIDKCGCKLTENHKDDAEDPHKCEEKFTRTVTLTFFYEWTPVKDKDDETKAAKEKALADAIAEIKTSIDDADKAQKPGDQSLTKVISIESDLTEDALLCDTCRAVVAKAEADKKAEEAAEKAKDEAAKLAKCTMAVTCEADKHHDDCLSLCTMNDKCENSVGVAEAHQVKYSVIQYTYNWVNVKEDKDKEPVDGTLKEKTEKTLFSFPAIDQARAYAKGQKLEESYTDSESGGDGTWTTYKYEVLAIHCPKAKVPDGVVIAVEADGTVTETPEEKPEKPTKAEDFTDMEDWMAEGVQFMLDKGWMEGLGDGKFGGRDDLKTTMVLTVLARMNGETITGSTWAEDATAWAEKNAEFFEGIDLTSDNMARKDVVLVLWRQAGKPEPSADFELEFTDVEGLEGDHLTAMKWAVENKIVLGNGDGTVSPDGNINRSALSLLTMRADKAANK